MAITLQCTKGTNLSQVGGIYTGVPERETAQVPSRDKEQELLSRGVVTKKGPALISPNANYRNQESSPVPLKVHVPKVS